MSEEMAVSDNTTGDEAKVSNDEASTAAVVEPEEAAVETSAEPVVPVVEEPPALAEEDPGPKVELNTVEKPEVKEEPPSDDIEVPLETPEFDVQIKHEVDVKDEVRDEIETFEHNIEEDLKRGIKRRASSAFSDTGDEDFKGFDEIKVEIKAEDYSRILDRLEAEVTAASKDLVPLRTVMATPVAPGRASKRPRKDTEGSRPSSALSSRSDGDGATDASATSSPAQRGGRRATTEMSSPLLRVPLERGWKRELVFRAALDAHSRRNADIYYYTPYGKKLRSTREVSEHLAGTGLTVENFSFFKEPLGVDDPEKEIIRDAKLIRRMDSPVAATVAPTQVEGKRTPKPKAPKGVSPEPVPPASAAPANKSPPAKIKVKSMGSRLSNSTPPAAPTPPPKQQKKPPPTKEKEPAPTKQPAPTKEPAPTTKEPAPQPKLQQPEPQPQPPPTSVSNTDNNNSAAWKKPSGGQCSASPGRPPPTPPPPRPPPQSAPQPEPVATGVRDSSPQTDRVHSSSSSTFNKRECPEPVRRPLVQPCSMSCGRGAVPSLSCAACLCLYHPACAGYHLAPPPYPFFCKNCRKSSSSPIEHKSVTTTSIPVPIPVPVLVPVVAPVPRRIPGPLPVPVKVPKLTVKHHSTPDGERVWAVAGTAPPARPAALPAAVAALPAAVAALPAAVAARADAPCAELPQSLALLNGRRFVVVPRNLVQAVPAAGDSAK